MNILAKGVPCKFYDWFITTGEGGIRERIAIVRFKDGPMVPVSIEDIDKRTMPPYPYPNPALQRFTWVGLVKCLLFTSVFALLIFIISGFAAVAIDKQMVQRYDWARK